MVASSMAVVADNRPDTGRVPGLERALTRSGEPVERKMTEAPEPEDKLDAATAVVGVVNGRRGMQIVGTSLGVLLLLGSVTALID